MKVHSTLKMLVAVHYELKVFLYISVHMVLNHLVLVVSTANLNN